MFDIKIDLGTRGILALFLTKNDEAMSTALTKVYKKLLCIK
jgi:hypothetical protein